MRTECLRDRLVSGSRDSKMITELLKVKLTNFSFHLAVQKCLAIEQANKNVQVPQGEQGSGTPVNNLTLPKLGMNQLHPNRHLRQKVPAVGTLRNLSLATIVLDHIAHKRAPLLRDAVFTVA